MTQDVAPAADPAPELPVQTAGPDPVPAPVTQRPFSILALLALIGGLALPALACLGSSLVVVARGPAREAPLLVSIVLTLGLVGLPLAWEAGQRLRGKASQPWLAHWTWIAASLAVILVSLIAAQTLISFNILPAVAAGLAQPIIFLAAAAGVLALAGSGWGGLSRLRTWGYLLTGAWLAVFLAFVAEVLVIGLAIAGVLVVLAAVAPAQLQALANLARSLSVNSDPDPRQITDWLLRPWVIGLAYLFASVVIPLLEELIKSLGVVFFIGQKPAPMTAFMGGLMGGLGFAVTESLSNLVMLQNPWAILVVARLGTLAMHSFTSSLVGWGWGQLAGGRPGRLGLAYLAAVSMHGLWNGAVVTIVFGGLMVADNPAVGSPATLGLSVLMGFCVILLVALVPACLVGLAGLGRRLRAG